MQILSQSKKFERSRTNQTSLRNIESSSIDRCKSITKSCFSRYFTVRTTTIESNRSISIVKVIKSIFSENRLPIDQIEMDHKNQIRNKLHPIIIHPVVHHHVIHLTMKCENIRVSVNTVDLSK